MKFCYIDESGTGDEQYAVMVGIIVDSYKMRPTKEDWNDFLSNLSELIGRKIDEIHTRDLYSGNSQWKNLKGKARSQLITSIFEWLRQRQHHIVYTAVDKALFNKTIKDEKFYCDIQSLWSFMAFHICLSLQKNFYNEKKNKGNFVLIFDKEVKEQKGFIDLIYNPPTWSDTYYNCSDEKKRLDQIIDVPHFVDSKHVGLIQCADFVSYFLRLYLELNEGNRNEKYENEKQKVNEWINLAFQRSIGISKMFPKKDRCEAADFFYKYIPKIFKERK